MENLTLQLVDTIDCQKSIYAEILRLTEDETSAVMKHKAAQVMTIVSQKEVLIKQLQNLEIKRLQDIHELASQLGLSDTPRLKEICSVLGPHSGQVLERAGQALTKVIAELEIANRQNQGLLNHALGLINGTIGVLSPAVPAQSVYRSSGQVTSEGKGGRFVSSEV